MVVSHNDIINAIAQARNIRHLLASDILERWQQGEEATAEQTQSLIQLGDWIDFLIDSEQLVVDECIDSTDVWNIIQQISEQAIGLDCVGTNYNYNNTPPTPVPNIYNYVESVTGLNTSNLDPQNPVVRISVDGTTITGQGTPSSPLVASIPPTGVQSVTDNGNGVVSVNNTDPQNPVVQFNGVNVDGTTITGDGTSGSPLVAIAGSGITLETNDNPNLTQTLLNLKNGTDITITDDGLGNVTINSTAGGSQNLQQVTTVGATTTDTITIQNGAKTATLDASYLEVSNGSGKYAKISEDGYLELGNPVTSTLKNSNVSFFHSVNLEFPDKPSGNYTIATTDNTVTNVTATSPITSSGGLTPNISTSMNTNKLIGRSTLGVGAMEEITIGSGLSLSAGTLTSTASGGGIPHATASGTDTYTATVTGVTAYNDGDAYLIRFTNGNTTSCTLNIYNGTSYLGAINLYRNNDGELIGGDIWAGAEMLCIYNSSLNSPIGGFQCIGTSPNSLFVYVTNGETSQTIAKGQAVYVSGGQGDRIKVKLANNTNDTTSAQTIGIVVSTLITPNNKGIVIVQGQLDGLSLFPTTGPVIWADGDFVYLDSISGGVTKTKPYAPNHLVYLGYVTTASNGGAGRMYVKVQNGYELDELHNVQAQSPADKDTLYYDYATSLWKTAQISNVLGYTPESTSNKSSSYTASSTTTYANTKALVDGLATKQDTITGGATTITSSNLTASRALASDASGKVAVSTVTSTELGYVSGVTSSIQTQIGTKQDRTPNVQSVSGAVGSVTPTSTNDIVVVTGLSATLTINNPTGTWVEGEPLIIRIRDNGTGRTLNFGVGYRGVGLTLPTTTVANKTIYLGIIYNSAESFWDVIGYNLQA